MADIFNPVREKLEGKKLKQLVKDIMAQNFSGLDLSGCTVSDDTARVLADALKNNTTLGSIDFGSDSVSPEGIATIAGAVIQSGNRNFIYAWSQAPNPVSASELQAFCADNREEALRLAEIIRDNPKTLSMSDIKELAGRMSAIVRLAREKPSETIIINHGSALNIVEHIIPSPELEKRLLGETDPNKRLKMALYDAADKMLGADRILVNLQMVATGRGLHVPKDLSVKELTQMASIQKSKSTVSDKNLHLR